MLIYSFEMFLVGIILFGGMVAAGIKIWLTRKQNIVEQSVQKNNSEQDHQSFSQNT